MTIKVLVISNYNKSQSSRPEAELFLGLKKMGLDIHIMTPAESEYAEKFSAAGIHVIDFLIQKKFDKKEIAFIRQILVNEKIQVMHLFNSRSTINGIRAAKGLPVKVVLYRGFTGNIHWYDPAAYLKYLHPRVDKIFCNSQSVQDQINSQLFFDKSKTIMINKGHSLDWYKDIKPQEPEMVSPAEFKMICTANNRPMKGIKYLVEAINLLPKDIPVHLLIAGGSKEFFENLDIIKNSLNRDKIHVLGFRQDSLNIVAACDVFISSSIFGESLTKSVVEAMCLGVAPLITDISGNKGLVIHRESGLVIPAKNPKAIADGIIELYSDREQCKRYGSKAKERIDKHFNHKDTVRKTYELYSELAK
ncbi:glycosyltransferase family 4 protein [Bacteroidota bacterium]